MTPLRPNGLKPAPGANFRLRCSWVFFEEGMGGRTASHILSARSAACSPTRIWGTLLPTIPRFIPPRRFTIPRCHLRRSSFTSGASGIGGESRWAAAAPRTTTGDLINRRTSLYRAQGCWNRFHFGPAEFEASSFAPRLGLSLSHATQSAFFDSHRDATSTNLTSSGPVLPGSGIPRGEAPRRPRADLADLSEDREKSSPGARPIQHG